MDAAHPFQFAGQRRDAKEEAGVLAPSTRLRHAIWSGLIALVLMLAMVLDPIDQFIWLVQSRIQTGVPSGQILFVASDRDMTDPANPERRIELAQALEELDRRGAKRIVLNMVFDELSNPVADKRLADAISRLDDKIYVAAKSNERSSRENLSKSRPEIIGKAQNVLSILYVDYLGIAWNYRTSVKTDQEVFQTIPEVLSHRQGSINGSEPTAYNFSPSLIAQTTLTELKQSEQTLFNRTILLGHSEKVIGFGESIPGYQKVSNNLIHVYAAETALHGGVTYLRPFHSLALGFTLLLVIIGFVVDRRTSHRLAYAFVPSLLFVLILAGPPIGLRFSISGAGAVWFIYFCFRAHRYWQRRAGFHDFQTGLARFAALENNPQQNGSGHIIVAKIHGFESALTTLTRDQKTTYVRKIAQRLRATDESLELYVENHYFGWIQLDRPMADIVEHLEGLRALFAAPLMFDDRAIDVGVTFGIAAIKENISAALAFATASAEEATEAANPIIVTDDGTQSDLVWSVSMRARIDAAMEAGEIYCLYQPKVDVLTGRLFGVEALARWQDCEKGNIPPATFIQQCEKAGRMEDLTRYMLQGACSAGRLLHSRGHTLSISVNVSATMLNSFRLVSIVREVLQATRFPPEYLVLEVTETARITDLAAAVDILDQLKALGTHISMDDFGVGAANFETFYRLPFDEIKIDRLFVSNIVADPKARAIAKSLIAMGGEAEIAVVAEGVETERELQILTDMGCSQVQGYALSKPINLAKLLEYHDETSRTWSGQAI